MTRSNNGRVKGLAIHDGSEQYKYQTNSSAGFESQERCARNMQGSQQCWGSNQTSPNHDSGVQPSVAIHLLQSALDGQAA
jgi:hypothetical protein